MSESSRSAPPGDGRLERCIRDLAALNALPSMCIGCSPDETLDVVCDALPTALSCELVMLYVPGPPTRARGSSNGAPLEPSRLQELGAELAAVESGGPFTTRLFPGLDCYRAEIPASAAAAAHQAWLVVGRRAPFDRETDRVLVRSAANLVGAAYQSAVVLEAARRKDEFLAMLGHELRNPLAPIQTAVELLARHPDVAREQHVIERNTRHLARLVDDLLDISRVTRGHIELKKEHVALSAVLERAIELAASLISRQKHRLRVDSAEGITLQGDPVRLAQVFGNLLTNAAKFTPACGAIDVSVVAAGDRVRVIVRDSGRGIAKEKLSRIFEPFVQVDRHVDALRGGLGLGLAIVHDLVQRHGGGVEVQSDGPGTGATFTVELPTVAAAAAVAKPAAPKPAPRRGSVRVLVVDDNTDLADLLSEALRIEGFETEVAFNAYEALDRWRSFTPHAAVLDVGLPELDGYELAKLIRAEHGSTPTLIAATGYGERKDRLRAADAGFDCHFVKPVSVRDLASELDERVVRALRN
jgi:signal transduction histidine kinase